MVSSSQIPLNSVVTAVVLCVSAARQRPIATNQSKGDSHASCPAKNCNTIAQDWTCCGAYHRFNSDKMPLEANAIQVLQQTMRKSRRRVVIRYSLGSVSCSSIAGSCV